MPRYCPRCGEALHTHSTTKGEVRKTSRRAYEDTPQERKKRAPSAYNRRYSAAFKKVAPRFKTKSGKWKKDGFKRAAAAARKLAKR